MVYIDKQGLIDRGWQTALVNLTDKANKPATMIDDTIVARHIADAESTIDGYLAKRYTLPLTDVPPFLVKIAADLAIYFVHGPAVGKDSAIAQAYRDGMRALEQIASGLLAVPGASGLAPTAASGGQIQTDGPDRIFTRDSLEGL